MPNPDGYHVRISDFIHCCGVFIIYGFDCKVIPKDFADYQRRLYRCGTEEDYKNYLKNIEELPEFQKRVRAELQMHMATYKNLKSYLVAITNTLEKEYGVEDILKEEGWEVLVPETRNPTGSKITMWIYHLLPREKTPVKSAIKRDIRG